MRYFWPAGLKRNALILAGSFAKALFVGAKKVPPILAVEGSNTSIRPVLISARSRVLKMEGTSSTMVLEESAGIRRLSIAWMTPFVAKISGLMTCEWKFKVNPL